MMRPARRGARGWVMIMVLLVLVVMTLLVASFYVTTSDAAGLSRVIIGQQVAVAHADTGMQEALRAVRSKQLDVSLISADCTSAMVDSGACTALLPSPLHDNGSSADLSANGGLQYQYMLYRRPITLDPGQPTNRYVIRSVGYYGYTTTSANLITSVVEAEVDIGNGSNFKCTNGYECQ